MDVTTGQSANPDPVVANPDHLIQEYIQISEHVRHFLQMRFASLPILAFVSGGLFDRIFPAAPSPGSTFTPADIMLSVLGLVLTLVFWAQEQRFVDYSKHYRARAMEIEKVLGLKLNETKPPNSFPIKSVAAMQIAYISLVFGWTVTLLVVWNPLHWKPTIIPANPIGQPLLTPAPTSSILPP